MAGSSKKAPDPSVRAESREAAPDYAVRPEELRKLGPRELLAVAARALLRALPTYSPEGSSAGQQIEAVNACSWIAAFGAFVGPVGSSPQVLQRLLAAQAVLH